MPDRKNNHYIPALYLRLFSPDEDRKSINLFHIPSEKVYYSCSIKHQARKPYFYGKDTETEDYLSEIETLSAPALHSIVYENKIPIEKSEEHLTILAFIANLKMRTPKSIEEHDENIDRLMKLYLYHNQEYLEKYGEESLQKLKLGIANSASHYLGTHALSFHLLQDLSMRILVNETEIPFITSDNPVIFYNEFMQGAPHRIPGIGIVSKGLEIILPLSSRLTLFLFDKDVYKVGDRNSNLILIDEVKTINSLNRLQVISASKNLYFGHQIASEYFIHILCAAIESRKKMKSKTTEIPHATDPDRSLIWTQQSHIVDKITFSFTKLLKKAKRFEFDDRATYVRDYQLLEAHERYVEFKRREAEEKKRFSEKQH